MTTDPSVVAAPVLLYTVSYFGKSITSGAVSVDGLMATINFPAVDSDVNVFVTALNVFGSGPDSNILMDKICKWHVFIY